MKSTSSYYTNKYTFFLALSFLFVILLLALLADVLTPFSFEEQNIKEILQPSSWKHWLGTDSLGRDLFSRLVYGARVSCSIGVLAALSSLLIGVVYGGVSGWIGGGVDKLMMRIIDVLMAVPSLILIILISTFMGEVLDFSSPDWRSYWVVVFAIVSVSWLGMARLVRAQVLSFKKRTFVESAKALGMNNWRILICHILPNIRGPLIVFMTLRVPGNILLESFLSFMGIGIQPPYASWGVLASEGWGLLQAYPHLAVYPGGVLFLTILSCHTIGSYLRSCSHFTH